MISLLKPALPSYSRSTSLQYRVGTFFEKILLSRIMTEINFRCLLKDEQFEIRTWLAKRLHLARVLKRFKRNFGEKRLTGLVFLDVAKAFDSVWIEGLLFKLTIFKFPSYLVKIIISYLHSRTFLTVCQEAIPSCRLMQRGVEQGRVISPVLFSLYLNGIPMPSYHIELTQYPGDFSLVVTSKLPAPLVKYLETHFSELEK